MTALDERPANRQGAPRKWGDTCWECRREVKPGQMRHGICGTCYQARRRAGTFTTAYVDPGPARDHLAALHATGASYRWIAEQAGTYTVNLNHIVQGRRERISGELATKILAVAIPAAADDRSLWQRALQTAGMQGLYVGVSRRYRLSREQRGVPYHKRDPQRHSLRATFLREREEFLAWLYEGMPAKTIDARPAPVVRTFDPNKLFCGDCDQQRCACHQLDDADLWMSSMADHDRLAVAS